MLITKKGRISCKGGDISVVPHTNRKHWKKWYIFFKLTSRKFVEPYFFFLSFLQIFAVVPQKVELTQPKKHQPGVSRACLFTCCLLGKSSQWSRFTPQPAAENPSWEKKKKKLAVLKIPPVPGGPQISPHFAASHADLLPLPLVRMPPGGTC